ncbi:MAG: aminotransferase class V-fold PLP-dependent enzyme [Gammaproteobacteria bacterium]|nr:aminotransferase class V-fold PLP-dependent enzyme [Gammaproteobacteria bacterium]NIR83895.1 aminotransferase class V-fold PLP-dependent enzyme [Gammaproteobacteria bacterium]NIR90674.1 aminotransferase class V-fold PLP-dependent enzyme [Gammaproteobacteria bacterium]NIV76063.1 aminotransferase class V-fold PLP-dependent enzyme [Gammaproteobacteria bacterium]
MSDGDERAANRRPPLDMSPAEFRSVGHELVDVLADFIASVPARATAPDVTPNAIRELLGDAPLPERGAPAERLFQEAARLVFGNTRLSAHPRYWGFIIGSPAPIGALAELMAAVVNANVVAWNGAPMPTEIERQAVRWIAELLGYPADCGGLFVSGGNMANFVGFLAARRAKAGWAVREQGLAAPGAPPLRAYVSDQTHTWVQKAADLFGLGTDAIRWIRSDARCRMDVAALEKRLRQDAARGEHPFLVVGTAGTVSTGAVDPLPELAALAREHDLWFHVDGAYGAPAVAVPEGPAALRGLREADSVAVDAHKWLYVPLEAGCALVREARRLRETFSYAPPYYHYYAHPGEEVVNFHEYGPQNSRGFRALKVWLALRQAGRAGYVEAIARDMALAATLYETLQGEDDFEAVTQGLSITTFRYVPADLAARAEAESYLNELNAELMARVQRSGEAYLSNAVIEGRFLLRACITNFHSSVEDVRALPGIVRRHGEALDRELRPAPLG